MRGSSSTGAGECRIIAVDRDPRGDQLRHEAALASFGGPEFASSKHALTEALDEASDVVEPLIGSASRPGRELAPARCGREGLRLSARTSTWTCAWPALTKRTLPTAAQLLNEATAGDLARIFRHEYGEEPRARRLAREVIARRVDALRFAPATISWPSIPRAVGRTPQRQGEGKDLSSGENR